MIAKKIHSKQEIEEGLKKAREQIWIHNIEIPLYYNSFQKRQDDEELAYWERENKNLEELKGEGTIERVS